MATAQPLWIQPHTRGSQPHSVYATRSVAFTISGNLATTTDSTTPIRYKMPERGTYIGCDVVVGTAPVGSTAIFDVHKEGTTLYTTQTRRPTIQAAATESAETATADVTALAAGDILTVNVDQVGSGTAGANATVVLKYRVYD